MNDRDFFEQAAARAEKINTACKDYEIARVTLETLEIQDSSIRSIEVYSPHNMGEDFVIPELTQREKQIIFNDIQHIFKERIREAKKTIFEASEIEENFETLREKFNVTSETPAIVNTLAETYANALNRKMQEAREEVKTEEPSTAAEEEPTKAAEKVSNERIEELLRQGLTHAQIAKMVGMTANAVSHRIAYIKDKKDREQGIEKPAPKPRAYTRDVISDAELEEQYFKHGLTIKAIAEKFGINPSSLYKRIEAMRDKRFEIAKECVSSQQGED